MSRRLFLVSSGVMSIVGGVMMIVSGFATHSFFLSILSLTQTSFAADLPTVVQTLIAVVLAVLNPLISLGGITVVAGGIALFLGHRSTGRVLIALGGGAGLFSLLIGLLYYSFAVGLSSVILHFEYWIGVALAVAARWLAGKT